MTLWALLKGLIFLAILCLLCLLYPSGLVDDAQFLRTQTIITSSIYLEHLLYSEREPLPLEVQNLITNYAGKDL